MTTIKTFAIFANGTYCGAWDGESAAYAVKSFAAEVGTDGCTDGMIGHEVDQDQVDALQDWAENDCPAGQCPIAV